MSFVGNGGIDTICVLVKLRFRSRLIRLRKLTRFEWRWDWRDLSIVESDVLFGIDETDAIWVLMRLTQSEYWWEWWNWCDLSIDGNGGMDAICVRVRLRFRSRLIRLRELTRFEYWWDWRDLSIVENDSICVLMRMIELMRFEYWWALWDWCVWVLIRMIRSMRFEKWWEWWDWCGLGIDEI